MLRNPLLLAEWIAVRNLVRRMRPRALTITLAFVALAVAAGTVLVTVGSRAAVLIEHRFMTILVVGLYTAFFVTRQRRRAEVRSSESWLLAAPIALRQRRAALAVVSVVPLLIQLLIAALVIGLLALVQSLTPSQAIELAAYVGAGAAAGTLIGWWSAARRRAPAYEGSRYVARAQLADTTTPSLDALSSWPVGQFRAWSRPENLRVVLFAAMLAVQAGSSALHGLCVVAMWLVAAYLGGLLGAVVRTARAAAVWLRSTPLSFRQFAWSLARRALLHELAGTVLAVAVMTILGAPPTAAAYTAGLWLIVVLVVFSIGLADSYRGRQPDTKIVLSLAAIAAIETREHLWSLPLAAFVVVWHLRAGAKA